MNPKKKRSARLIGLGKPQGGIRPIAVGLTLRRLYGKLALSEVLPLVKDTLRDFGQVGVGIPAGAEAIIHSANRLLEKHGDETNWSLLTVDFKNAFNTIDRNLIFDQVAHLCPALLPFIKVLYEGQTHLVHGSFWLTSQTGVQQGDPLGPLLFALGLLILLKNIREECPELALNAWFLDDGSLVGPSPVVAKALKIIQEASPTTGLEVNLEKCELFWPSVNPTHEDNTFPAQISRSSTGVKLLGGAVSCLSSFHDQVFNRRVEKAIAVIKQIGELEDPAHELQLLRASASGLRVLHGLRVCPPQFISGGIAHFDTALWDALRDIVVAGGSGFGEVEFEWASLPCDRGGLGVTQASFLAKTAFVSAYTCTSDLQDHLLRSELYPLPPPLSSFTQACDALQSSLPDSSPEHFARRNPFKTWAKPLVDARVEWIKERNPRAQDLLEMTSSYFFQMFSLTHYKPSGQAAASLSPFG